MKINEEAGKLDFSIYNFKGNGIKDSVSGIGITNVKKRLEILYPKKFILNINENENDFSIQLIIDLKP